MIDSMDHGLFLGIDGGGTKTRFILGDVGGRVLADVTTGGMDYQDIGYEGVKSRISDAVQGMLADTRRGFTGIASVCAGMPRIGESAAWDAKCPELLRKIFPKAGIHCVNDVQVGLYGSLCLESGIHLVCGTGSIAMGMGRDGSTCRVGGWGSQYSDEGSGYWLGLKTWRLFSKQFDGRLPKTSLYDLVMEKTRLTNPEGFVVYFDEHVANKRDELASYQPLLEKAAADGDAEAAAVYLQAGAELAQMALAVYRALTWETPVQLSYSGGVFRCGDLLLLPLKEALRGFPITVRPPRLLPAQGALLYAVCSGNADPAFRESVIRNIIG